MSRNIVPLEYGKFYHIYNRGINSQNIFFNKENYLYFMQLYGKYIENIAETFAWCFMPKHFHFLVRIKDEEEIGFFPPNNNLPDIEPLLGHKATKRVIISPTSLKNHVGF